MGPQQYHYRDLWRYVWMQLCYILRPTRLQHRDAYEKIKQCATKHLAAEYVGALSLGHLQKKIMADVLDFFCIFIFSLTSIGTKIYLLRLVVPELLLVLAYHLGYNELHLL